MHQQYQCYFTIIKRGISGPLIICTLCVLLMSSHLFSQEQPIAVPHNVNNISQPEASLPVKPQTANNIGQNVPAQLNSGSREGSSSDNISNAKSSLPTGQSSQDNQSFYYSPVTSGKYVFYKWHGSLMYDAHSISLLEKAMKDRVSLATQFKAKTNNPLDNLLGSNNKPIVAPTFYLNSIIFNSPNSWVIWMNGRKINHDQGQNLERLIPDLSIVSVTKDLVVFSWVTPFLDYIIPNWKNKLLYLGDNKYTSVNDTIIVQEKRDSNTVTFSLEPNQTFVVHDLGIAEGYEPPTQITPTKSPGS